MQLDDHLKNLLRELGHAINDTVSDSDRITGAIAGVRAHGYDIVLKLDATIGLAKRDAAAAEAAKLTTQDRRFLESLRIQVDQEPFSEDNDKKPAPRLARPQLPTPLPITKPGKGKRDILPATTMGSYSANQ